MAAGRPRHVPSLAELSLEVLAANIERLQSLENLPEELALALFEVRGWLRAGALLSSLHLSAPGGRPGIASPEAGRQGRCLCLLCPS